MMFSWCLNYLNFILQMKADRSKGKRISSDLYFLIHPLSVQFDREYNHNYILYFQKDLHIFQRYDILENMIRKNKRYIFEIPQSIQSHLARSENQLDFKWSLYTLRMLDNYQEEEYTESKKANLKWCLHNYRTYGEHSQMVEVIFGMVKFKMHYLFILGTSHDQVMESLQKYYKDNKVIPTKVAELLEKQAIQQQERYREGLVKSATEDYWNPTDYDFKKAKRGDKINLSNINLNSQLRSLPQEFVLKSSDTPGLSSIDEERDKINQNSLIKTKSKLKLRRLTSEQEMSKDIQMRIQESGDRIQMSPTNHPSLNSRIMLGDSLLSESKVYQDIKKITSSQHLNKKGELIITPFYVQFKYWLIILAIFFIFFWVLDQGPKQRPGSLIQSHGAHSPHHHRVKDSKKLQKGQQSKQKSGKNKLKKEKKRQLQKAKDKNKQILEQKEKRSKSKKNAIKQKLKK